MSFRRSILDCPTLGPIILWCSFSASRNNVMGLPSAWRSACRFRFPFTRYSSQKMPCPVQSLGCSVPSESRLYRRPIPRLPRLICSFISNPCLFEFLEQPFRSDVCPRSEAYQLHMSGVSFLECRGSSRKRCLSSTRDYAHWGGVTILY